MVTKRKGIKEIAKRGIQQLRRGTSNKRWQEREMLR
jgi:hypothetical protein